MSSLSNFKFANSNDSIIHLNNHLSKSSRQCRFAAVRRLIAVRIGRGATSQRGASPETRTMRCPRTSQQPVQPAVDQRECTASSFSITKSISTRTRLRAQQISGNETAEGHRRRRCHRRHRRWQQRILKVQHQTTFLLTLCHNTTPQL